MIWIVQAFVNFFILTENLLQSLLGSIFFCQNKNIESLYSSNQVREILEVVNITELYYNYYYIYEQY